MDKKELGEVGKWKDKALSSKGGIVTHKVGDVSKIKKLCCNKNMGEKCNCRTSPLK